MVRIEKQQISDLKAAVCLGRLIEAHGTKRSRRGAVLFELCPYHVDEERTL